MSTVAAGKMFFVKPLNYKEYTELSNFITKMAVTSKIGVNLQYNISERIKRRFIPKDTDALQLSWMAYELTESPWYSQSDALFDGVAYNNDLTCAGLDKKHSKAIRIQDFFESVFESDFIKEVTFELWEESPPEEGANIHFIHPKDFFDSLNETYKDTKATDSSLTPTMQMKMLR